MSLNLISRVNQGWESLEPIVLGLMALNRNFMIIGRHGSGKTRLAKVLSQGYGKEGYVFYDATKDDMVSIAGLPDVDGFKTGTMQFIPHQRSIWNKSTVVVDEITRAGKESQNLWLEILEERTCFGIPLTYRSFIATANPESYAAAFQLDEALLDRFHGVIPVPDSGNGLKPEQAHALLELSFQATPTPESSEISRAFAEIQAAHQVLRNGDALKKVTEYVSRFVPLLLSSLGTQGPYVSARTWGRMFPETILSVAAYYEVVGDLDALEKGAWEAVTYALGTKLNLKLASLKEIHHQTKSYLSKAPVNEASRMRLNLQGLVSFEDRLAYLQKHKDDLKEKLKADEMEKFLGDLLRGASRKGERDKLVVLKAELDNLGYQGDLYRQLDGQLILTLNSAISSVLPQLVKLSFPPKESKAQGSLVTLQAMIQKGTLLASTHPDAMKLKAWLIDLYEGDSSLAEPDLKAFLASLELPVV